MPKRDNLLDQGEQEKSPNIPVNKRELNFTANSTDNDNLEEWILEKEEDRRLRKK